MVWYFIQTPRATIEARPGGKADERIEKRVKAHIKEEEEEWLEAIEGAIEDQDVSELLRSHIEYYEVQLPPDLRERASPRGPFLFINQLPPWLPPTVLQRLARTHADCIVLLRRGTLASLLAPLAEAEENARRRATGALKARRERAAIIEAWRKASLREVDWPLPNRRGPEDEPALGDDFEVAVAAGSMMKRISRSIAAAEPTGLDLVLIFGRGLSTAIVDVEALEAVVRSGSLKGAKAHFAAVRLRFAERMRQRAAWLFEGGLDSPQDRLMSLATDDETVSLDDHDTVLGEYLHVRCKWKDRPGDVEGWRLAELEGPELKSLQMELERIQNGTVDRKLIAKLADDYGPSLAVVESVLREGRESSRHPNRKRMERLAGLAKKAEVAGCPLFVLYEA